MRLQLKERFGLVSRKTVSWTVICTLLGIGMFFLSRFLRVPGITVDLFTFEIVPYFIVLVVFAAFGGPLTGFLTGFCGTLLFDALVGGTIVWAGTAALGFGLFGFIAGWPMVRKDPANGRNFVKLAVASLLGWLLNAAILLLGALVVGQMSILLALLWILLPYLTTGLTTIIVFPPIVVRLCQLLWTEALKPGYHRLRPSPGAPNPRRRTVHDPSKGKA
jgi:uncharacterized membrane protein